MNRHDLQLLSEIRVQEATILLRSGCYAGAYYLLGYAVEYGLKACIAKQIRQYEFPDRSFVNKIYTHSLDVLLDASGLKPEFEREMRNNPHLALNWAMVKDWDETSRYRTDISEPLARDFHSAVTDERNGVLAWLKKQW